MKDEKMSEAEVSPRQLPRPGWREELEEEEERGVGVRVVLREEKNMACGGRSDVKVLHTASDHDQLSNDVPRGGCVDSNQLVSKKNLYYHIEDGHCNAKANYVQLRTFFISHILLLLFDFVQKQHKRREINSSWIQRQKIHLKPLTTIRGETMSNI